MRPLVLAQQLALEALGVQATEYDWWTYPGAIKARSDTLKALVTKGLAERRGYEYRITSAGLSWLTAGATREPSPPFHQALTGRGFVLKVKALVGHALAATIHSPADLKAVRAPLTRALELCIARLIDPEPE